VDQIIRIGMDTSKHIFSCMGLMLPSRCVAQEAAAQPGAVVFCEVAAPLSEWRRVGRRITGRGSCASSGHEVKLMARST